MNKPEKPIRRTNKASALDEQIIVVLDKMLEGDEEITHRAVIRSVPGISAVSSVTRDNFRRELVEYYQQRQKDLRSWVGRAKKTSHDDLSSQLAKKDVRIADLERQVATLTASHKALLLAVGETGGVAAWKRFFENYQDILDSLDRRPPLSIVQE